MHVEWVTEWVTAIQAGDVGRLKDMLEEDPALANATADGKRTMLRTATDWPASSDDVEAIDALLDGGADIEATGAVIDDGTAMADAVVFTCFRAARRLVERGAQTNLWQSAALGLRNRVERFFAATPGPSADEVTNAFWHACRSGQRAMAEWLLARGADLNWVGHDGMTPLDAARRNGAVEVVEWLEGRGAGSGMSG